MNKQEFNRLAAEFLELKAISMLEETGEVMCLVPDRDYCEFNPYDDVNDMLLLPPSMCRKIPEGVEEMNLQLPEYVEICPVCEGAGKYEQWYNAGCGGGNYKSLGPCDWCKHPSVFMRGLGYRMKDGTEVPLSVINQIEEGKK